jgi:hypothetical protein
MLRTFCNQRFVRQQHKFIDWTKQASRSNIREEHNKHTGQRICSQRSLPLRKATSPLRYPQRAGYYEEPFASSQLTTKEVRNPRKKGRLDTSSARGRLRRRRRLRALFPRLYPRRRWWRSGVRLFHRSTVFVGS